ncbi:hypothetical protein SO802_017661 [Lithocarpus litseifolius]|uniref:Serine/threonine-protein kinase BSK1-like TPR repeats domain-containing protein n=1 Tax=Lithocarpus litseifolius TaxID=425828 RepID=A0AAW2CKN3_9ROSI
MEVMMGSKNGFLTKRLKVVNGINDSLIYLLPVILKAVDTFLEELIVRRELVDNFCFYQHHYDSLQGAWEWACRTLMDRASDEREHIYTQLEKAKTADPLWNASQLEMVYYGKRHGFMMYWAKKILEWTRGPEDKLSFQMWTNQIQEMLNSKKRGDAAFRSKDFANALSYYTQGPLGVTAGSYHGGSYH